MQKINIEGTIQPEQFKPSKQSRNIVVTLGTIAFVVGIIGITKLGRDLQQDQFAIQETDNSLNLILKVDPKIQNAYNNYISRFSRSFLTKEEYKARLGIFLNNYELVTQHNQRKDSSYKMALNKFSDMAQSEIKALNALKDEENLYSGKMLQSSEYGGLPYDADQLLKSAPSSLDWRDKGAVNPVYEQGKVCGACYTFATTGAVEGIYKLKNGKLLELSKQQILDCSQRYGNSGCQGGYMTNAYQYMKDYKIQPYDSYPYVGKTQTCAYDQAKGLFSIKSFVSLQENDPMALFNAIQTQPISIGVQSSKNVFHQYKSGVLDAPDCGNMIDHAMLLIGYGHDQASGKDYWLIKNSWGTDWGDNGYLKIFRDIHYHPKTPKPLINFLREIEENRSNVNQDQLLQL